VVVVVVVASWPCSLHVVTVVVVVAIVVVGVGRRAHGGNRKQVTTCDGRGGSEKETGTS